MNFREYCDYCEELDMPIRGKDFIRCNKAYMESDVSHHSNFVIGWLLDEKLQWEPTDVRYSETILDKLKNQWVNQDGSYNKPTISLA